MTNLLQILIQELQQLESKGVPSPEPTYGLMDLKEDVEVGLYKDTQRMPLPIQRTSF